MRYTATAVCLLIFHAAGAQAQYLSPNLSPTTVSPVSVQIDDQADGGCWTNLAEAKTYAEDKLGLLGYEVLPDKGAFNLKITAVGTRLSDGTCAGGLLVSLERVVVVDKVLGVHVVASHDGMAAQVTTLNNFIIESVQQITDAMREKAE